MALHCLWILQNVTQNMPKLKRFFGIAIENTKSKGAWIWIASKPTPMKKSRDVANQFLAYKHYFVHFEKYVLKSSKGTVSQLLGACTTVNPRWTKVENKFSNSHKSFFFPPYFFKVDCSNSKKGSVFWMLWLIFIPNPKYTHRRTVLVHLHVVTYDNK